MVETLRYCYTRRDFNELRNAVRYCLSGNAENQQKCEFCAVFGETMWQH
jgi:hypothetical protein